MTTSLKLQDNEELTPQEAANLEEFRKEIDELILHLKEAQARPDFLNLLAFSKTMPTSGDEVTRYNIILEVRDNITIPTMQKVQ